jgi:hypothetical protein
MRTIKLTHEEIDLIKIALTYISDKKLDIIAQNRNILTEEEQLKIYENYKKYFDTQKVFDGERDV